MSTCRNCGKELEGDVKFCPSCGKQIESSKSNSISTLSSRLGDSEVVVPIVGIVGILLIFLAIFNLVDPSNLNISFSLLLYILAGVGVLLWFAGLVLVYTKTLNSFSQLLVLITGKSIIFSVIFLADLVFRTTLTRYLFLGWSVIIFLFGMVLPYLREFGFAGTIFQLSTTYIGFVMLIILSDSDYISRLIYSLALLTVILITHYVIIDTESVYLLFWAVPLEFFTLLQTSVVNSSFIIPTTILLVLSIPSFLYLFRSKEFVLTFNDMSVLELLLILPQLAIIFVIANGGIVSPYAELILAVFVFAWIVYLYLEQKSMVTGESSPMARLSIAGIFGAALLGFALSNQLLSSMILISIIFILPLILDRGTQLIAISVSYVGSFLALSIFALLHTSSVELLFVLIMIGMILQIVVLKIREFTTVRLLYLAQFWSGWVTFWLSIFEVNFGYFLIFNTIFQLVIHQIKGLDKPKDGIVTSILIALPSVVILNIPFTEDLKWIILGCQTLAIVYSLISDNIRDKLINIGILLLPLVFVLSANIGNVFLNTVIGVLVVVSILFMLQSPASLDHQLLGSSILVGAIILRDIVSTESGSVLMIPIQQFTISVVLVIFTLMLLFQFLTQYSSGSNLVVLLGWLVGIQVFLRFLGEIQEEFIIKVLYFAVSGILVILLAIELFIDKDRSDWRIIAFLSIFLVFVYINSYIELYFIPWLAISGVFLYLNHLGSEMDDITQSVAFLFGLLLNFALFAGIGKLYLAISLALIFEVVIIPGRIQRFLLDHLSTQNYIILTILHGLISMTILGILVQVDLLLKWHMVIVYFTIAILFCYEVYTLNFRGMPALVSIIVGMGAVYLQQMTSLSWIIFGVSVVTILFILSQEDLIHQHLEDSIVQMFNFVVLSLLFVYLLLVIQLGGLVIEEGLLGFVDLNRVLVGFGLLILVISAMLQRMTGMTNLTAALLCSGGATFIISNFIGFFDIIISNILFGIVAIITALLGLYSKNRDLFYLGISLSTLSVLRAILDWIILDDPARSLSLLIVGFQIIFYAIVMNNLGEIYFSPASASKNEIENMNTHELEDEDENNVKRKSERTD